jgi:hypothetical protein
MNDDEISRDILKLVELGYNRKEAIDIYFASHKEKVFNPNACYNNCGSESADSEDLFSSLRTDQKMPYIVPSHLKGTDSDDEYGTVINEVCALYY